jgi:hypothetical protein
MRGNKVSHRDLLFGMDMQLIALILSLVHMKFPRGRQVFSKRFASVVLIVWIQDIFPRIFSPVYKWNFQDARVVLIKFAVCNGCCLACIITKEAVA